MHHATRRPNKAAGIGLLALIERLDARRLFNAATVDTVVFGNTTSETSHTLVATSSQIIAGGVGQSARQLLPLSTVGVNGGDLTFTMNVDPVKRNYFTVKLYGSDDTDSGKGRLYLYSVVNGVNYQVGYRHEGDYAPLSVTAGKPTLPGRFMYSTTLLPLSMTQGKTSVTLKIVSTGELYGLGSGGPPTGNYQMNMDTASRGVYAAYTHTQAMLDVSGESQGTAPTTTTAPSVSAASILGPSGTFTTGLKNWVTGRLNALVTAFTTSDVQMLATAYTVPQLTNAYQSVTVVNKIISVIDGFATDYFTNPTTSVTGSSGYGNAGGNEVWGGRFGPLGWAIHLLASNPTFQSSLDTVVNFGATGGNQTRRAAWSSMLAASRDSGRFSRDNRYLTNQSILADLNIYRANSGLLDLGSSLAMTETAAQRYLKESAGLLPWLGSDLAAGGSSLKYGDNYYQVTPDGLTREWGYAGGYSEMATHIAEMYRMTGNADFRNQATKMGKAIAYFRRPAIEVSGTNYYRAMWREGVLAWRGVREADGYVANDVAYAGPAGFAAGLTTAAATGDPTLIGYAKQMLADNQYLSALTADSRYYSSLTFDSMNVFDAFDDYTTITNAADSGARLPMTAGQPDTTFADETDGIVAIKRGNDLLYVEPFWQAKTGTGTNGLSRFDFITPTYEQYGTLETTNVQYTSDGAYFVRPNLVDTTSSVLYAPPDNPTQAYAGESLPIAVGPDDAGDDTPFRGHADFYALRFGNYLIGLNTTDDKGYILSTPNGFTSAVDLISGATMVNTVTVPAQKTVALYLPSNLDATPLPSTPLLLTARGTPTAITLNWSAAGGATGYTVKRSTAGGAFVTLATNVTATTYTDSAVTRGTAYAYVISATNANGAGDNSSVARSSAGLPVGWSNADIGTVALAGSSSLVDGVFTVRGSGGDVGSTADSFQFAYSSLTGNGSVVARVDSTLFTNGADKIGLMLRDSTATGSRHVSVSLTDATNTVSLISRSSANGSTSSSGTASPIDAPIWLKLTRSSNTFTAATSADGVNWATFATANVTLNSSVLAGLFVCSRYSQQINATRFSQVSVTGTASPAVSSFTIGSGAAQRSMIRSLTLNFSKPVHLGTNAIVLSGATNIPYTLTPVNDVSSYVLTFTASNFIGGSLGDGNYQLTLNPSAITDVTTGQALTTAPTYSFFRLFGDGDGNGVVNFNDFLSLQNAFGTTPSSPVYNSAFDYDSNSLIDFNDFLAFQNQFGFTAAAR